MHFTIQNPVYCWPGLACWAAGQCGAERPVMCGAGLRVRCWGGCVVAGQAEQGAWIVLAGRCGCLHRVERWFYGSKLRVLVEQLGFWLAAAAVYAVVLIWKLARMNFLTIRVWYRLYTRLRSIFCGDSSYVIRRMSWF